MMMKIIDNDINDGDGGGGGSSSGGVGGDIL